MCHPYTGENFDRPITKDDIGIIHKYYATHITLKQVESIYKTITDKNYPQPGVLVMVLDLIVRTLKDDTGMYPIVIAPFSGMDLHSGERIQSKEMYAFHSVFESFALAQRNVRLLNNYLSDEFNGEIVLFCDCGCGFLPNNADSFIKNMINDINAFRSYYESIGTNVIQTNDFNDGEWKKRTVDLGETEKNAYKRMYTLLTQLPDRKVPEPVGIKLVREQLQNMLSNKQKNTDNTVPHVMVK